MSILPSTGKQLWDVSFGPFVGTDVLEVEVPGLGDAAGGSKSGDDVMVLKGDVLFGILFIEFGRQDKGPVTRHLAEIVLDKLPCLATGCAGATAPPASTGGSTVDACALLTDQEIKAATHFATTGHEAGQATDCRWTLDTGSDLPGLHSIRLAIQLTGGREQWDFLSQGLPQVPALGDGAFKLGGNTDGSIKALAGDRVISLDYSLPVQTADPDPLIIPLLKSALSRLPGSRDVGRGRRGTTVAGVSCRSGAAWDPRVTRAARSAPSWNSSSNRSSPSAVRRRRWRPARAMSHPRPSQSRRASMQRCQVPRCGLGPVCPRLHRSRPPQRIGQRRRESDRAERCGRRREVGLRLGELVPHVDRANWVTYPTSLSRRPRAPMLELELHHRRDAGRRRRPRRGSCTSIWARSNSRGATSPRRSPTSRRRPQRSARSDSSRCGPPMRCSPGCGGGADRPGRDRSATSVAPHTDARRDWLGRDGHRSRLAISMLSIGARRRAVRRAVPGGRRAGRAGSHGGPRRLLSGRRLRPRSCPD